MKKSTIKYQKHTFQSLKLLYFASTNIEKMLTTLLITVIILVICVVLLSVKVIFKKGGKFPNTHIEGNAA